MKTKFVRLSVRRPSIRVAIIFAKNADFFHILIVVSPGLLGQILKFWTHIGIFMNIFFVFVNTGRKISQRYSSYKPHPKVFKIVLKFLSIGLHKSTVLNVFDVSLQFLTFFFVFINVGPYGTKIFRTLPLSNHYSIFRNFYWIFFSIGFTKVRFWIFDILNFWF